MAAKGNNSISHPDTYHYEKGPIAMAMGPFLFKPPR